MYKSSYTGSQIDEAVAKANEAAPQSTTYTKPEVDSALSGKQATLVVGTNLDSAPTENSTNPVTSGGVYQALSGKANTSDLGAAAAKGFDALPTSGNTNNAVSSDGVYQALVQIVSDQQKKKFVKISNWNTTFSVDVSDGDAVKRLIVVWGNPAKQAIYEFIYGNIVKIVEPDTGISYTVNNTTHVFTFTTNTTSLAFLETLIV